MNIMLGNLKDLFFKAFITCIHRP